MSKPRAHKCPLDTHALVRILGALQADMAASNQQRTEIFRQLGEHAKMTTQLSTQLAAMPDVSALVCAVDTLGKEVKSIKKTHKWARRVAWSALPTGLVTTFWDTIITTFTGGK